MSLSKCRMNESAVEMASLQGCFDSLKVLVLNQTLLDFGQVASLAPCLPALEQLRLAKNELTTLEHERPVGPFFEKLSYLGLEENALEWGAVAAVADLPALETLVLDKNKIEEITPLESPAFARLQALSFIENNVTRWECVDTLDTYPMLGNVQLYGNPVFVPQEGVQKEANTDIGVYELKLLRHVAISRLPKITKLNHTAVSRGERQALRPRTSPRTRSIPHNHALSSIPLGRRKAIHRAASAGD